jgi:flagellar export protein FliJ
MAFRFSLQPVLDQRLAQEEQAQRQYARALAWLEGLRRRRQEIENEIKSCRQQISLGQRRGMDLARRDLYERWIEHQHDQIRILEKRIEAAAQAAEQERRLLVQATQKRTIMEKLYEREQADWRRDQQRSEIKTFNEFAVRDWAAQKRRRKDRTGEKATHPRERIAR